MSPYELKMKLDLADDRARFVKEHSMSFVMNVIVTDDGHMHFFDSKGNDITKSTISIKDSAFSWCESLKSIIIPDSVKSIGADAFNNCTSLTSIVIPDSVKSIGDSVFRWCPSLKRVVFKGKTIEEVQFMVNYPWGVEDKSVFKLDEV